jgi:hypothetical protein
VQVTRKWGTIAALAFAATALAPRLLTAQVALPAGQCDFDIADNLGRFTSQSTVHLNGIPGAGTNQGTFFIINGNTAESDVDLDGYNPTCSFTALYIATRDNLVNVTNPSLIIPGANITVTRFPPKLAPGERAETNISVEVPAGTPSGTYRGFVEVRDNIIITVRNSTGDLLNRDLIYVEVVVSEQRSNAFISPDSSARLDSIIARGQAGQRATATFRFANTGNVQLTDVRLSASDLRSESAVGLVIPAQNITFSPPSFSSFAVGDTGRITVSVQIPRAILGGRYRGTILAQGSGANRVEIPFIVIVTSSAGILFTDNPVRAGGGAIARISFNGDPGTTFRLAIFTMDGRTVYKTDGTVFAGVNGTNSLPTPGADFAVTVPWGLVNGLGERVASGMYLVIVESVVAGRRTVAQGRLMVIR